MYIYFGLMDVVAGELGVTGVDYGWGPVSTDEVLTPCFNSLPMGFSWSLYFCEATAEHQVLQSPGMSVS